MNLKTNFKLIAFMRANLEAFIWLIALFLLFTMNPETTQPSLCFFHYLGLDTCPGCGLGHSIAAAAQFNWSASIEYHPLGIFSIVILIVRIVSIFYQNAFFQLKYRKL